MALTQMDYTGNGGSVLYAHGENEDTTSNAVTVNCGFEPKMILLRFQPVSGKYRYNLVWSAVQNENTSILYVSTITYSPSDTYYSKSIDKIENASYNASFSVTSSGFTIGQNTANTYSAIFDWEAWG